MFPGILLISISVFLLILAYLLYFKQAYRLISGINFYSMEQASERYDLIGLTRHHGIMCAIIGFVMFLTGVLSFFREQLIFIPMFSLFIIIPIILFGSERFVKVGRKTQRIINIVITVFIEAIGVFVIIMMLTGSRMPEVYIENETLFIDSSYGTEVQLDSIEEIVMVNLSDRNLYKLNGFNMGNTLRGEFRVEDIGNVKLYQQGEPGDSILIKAKDQIVIINLGSESANEELKLQIENSI